MKKKVGKYISSRATAIAINLLKVHEIVYPNEWTVGSFPNFSSYLSQYLITLFERSVH